MRLQGGGNQSWGESVIQTGDFGRSGRELPPRIARTAAGRRLRAFVLRVSGRGRPGGGRRPRTPKPPERGNDQPLSTAAASRGRPEGLGGTAACIFSGCEEKGWSPLKGLPHPCFSLQKLYDFTNKQRMRLIFIET